MNIIDELKKNFRDRAKENFPLDQYTSFKTGGKGKIVVFPVNKSEIEKIFSLCEKYKEKVLILGKGTNVLISDYGFDGVIISTLFLNRIRRENNFVICECGVSLSSLLNFCLKNNIGGVEFLSGIPGTVGGACITNAGLKRRWLGEKIEWVEVYDGEEKKFKVLRKDEIEFSYRDSNLKDKFVMNVCFKLEEKEKVKIIEEIRKFIYERKKKQPVGEKSAGSIFKNPEGCFAGKIIEECGFKGFCIGDACVSEKHANFIINKEKAKSSEIYKVMETIKSKVKEKCGIQLVPEIKIIGKF